MTVSPGWYGDGVTPGVERWFDGRGWTETTRPTAPTSPTVAVAPGVAASPVTAAVPAGNAWLPQEPPALPEPTPEASAPFGDPFADAGYAPRAAGVADSGVPRGGAQAVAAAPGFSIPALEPLEPEPAHASSAAAAGYPTFGTPYRGPGGGAGVGPVTAAGAPAASPYTSAAAAAPPASPYTSAAAAPYTSAATAPSASVPPPPPPPPTASPYASAPAAGFGAAGFGAAGLPVAGSPASRFGSDVDFAGVGAGGQPYGTGGQPYGTGGQPYGTGGQPYGAGVGAPSPGMRPTFGAPSPGMGPTFGAPSQDLLERAFRSGASEKANSDRQSALVVGGLGVGLLVVAGVVLRATLSTGTGTVWTWGFLAGGALLVRALMAYVSAVRRGARHLGPLGWTVSGGALLLAGVVVVTSIQAAFSPMPVEVGSCFTDEGPEVQQVDCAAPHDYTAVAVVATLGECPSYSDVFARFDDDVVCLVDDGLGFGD